VRTAKLRALGVTAASRSPELPNVPTIAEAGVPGYEAAGWNALLAPRATPRDVVLTVNAAVIESLSAPRVRQILASSGADAAGGPPEALARFLESEVAKWGKVVRSAGIKPE
jgi:tripartite-type tricarboxylate transporter receptor subunit TctC